MNEVKSIAEALQIFEADLACDKKPGGKSQCNRCFIFPLIRTHGECDQAVHAAERYIINAYRNRQNRQP